MASDEPEGPLMHHGDEVAGELKKCEKASEAVQHLIKLSALDEYELFRFYETGGVHTWCELVKGSSTDDADDVDGKLMLMITSQTILAVGQMRSLAVLKGCEKTLADIACNLLRMTGIEGGSEKDLLYLHLEAAGCLNIVPLPVEQWCTNDIPGLCMTLLEDRSFLKESSDSATGGATNLLDAGLMLTGNFLASQEFFTVVMELGLVEAVMRLGEVITEDVYLSEYYQFTLIRLLSLMLSLVNIKESKAKITFISDGIDEAHSLISHLIPHLTTHPHITIRSLAHQTLADYTGVNHSTHEWVLSTPKVTNINQSNAAFNKKRPCSQPGCPSSEELPLSFSWCSKCKVPAYCSSVCQKKHWPVHKTLCKTLAISEA
eukprot:TRINITY_DN9778_c1_g1_i1.p1 TRINITY_DN9778_c1_g1~~TRINITY_DN9778_c1_g1_i1.p1  ORF type:complete len:375 (+),score=85.33 TRINITY_DN9778_c1_g1_i1:54-1178(+)